MFFYCLLNDKKKRFIRSINDLDNERNLRLLSSTVHTFTIYYELIIFVL